MNVSTPIWRPTPERMANARMRAFMQRLQPASASPLDDYESLYRFSLSQPAAFWGGLWDYLGLRGEKGGLVVDDPLRLPGAAGFPRPGSTSPRTCCRATTPPTRSYSATNKACAAP